MHKVNHHGWLQSRSPTLKNEDDQLADLKSAYFLNKAFTVDEVIKCILLNYLIHCENNSHNCLNSQ